MLVYVKEVYCGIKTLALESHPQVLDDRKVSEICIRMLDYRQEKVVHRDSASTDSGRKQRKEKTI